MKKCFTCFLTLFCLSLINAQPLTLEWQKSLGGTLDDYALVVAYSNDGGYIVAGESFSSNGDVTGNHGEGDFWIVKLDSSHEIEWQKCLGGSERDRPASMVCNQDGTFLVIGFTYSSDGDVKLNHGQNDIWLVKLDENGNLIWEKTYGNSDGEEAACIAQTSDGGFVIGGTGGYCNNPQGYIIKIDSIGDVEWEQEVGGYGVEKIYSVKQDPDNNYVFAGYSQSYSIGGSFSYDFYVGVLDNNGNLLWHNRYGGKFSDWAYSVEISHQGGYIVVGKAGSNDGDVTGNQGVDDFWIIELDKEGNLLWQQCYGGTSVEWAYDVKPTSDNGYIIVGKAFSNNGHVTGNNGWADFWIIKIDQSGSLLWQKTYGGSESDIATSMELGANNQLLVTGMSWSEDGDVTGHHGIDIYSDYWLVELSLMTGTELISNNKPEKVSVFPIPAKDILTIKSSEMCYFELLDSRGGLLDKGNVFNKKNLDISLYESGLYFIRISDMNGRAITTEKIVKQ